MKSLLILLLSLALTTRATFIKKWNLFGCPSGGMSERCNSLPQGFCCNKGTLRGGSVRIDNLPSYVDIAVPYNGRRRGDGMSQAQPTHCANIKFSQIRNGAINCYSGDKLGTGTWIHCSRNINPRQCLQMHSHPKRSEGKDSDGDMAEDEMLDLSQYGTPHPGYIDEEEAALPYKSYHDGTGKQISKEEYDIMAAIEKAHEANGTLHWLYPETFPPDYMDYYYDIPKVMNEMTLEEVIQARQDGDYGPPKIGSDFTEEDDDEDDDDDDATADAQGDAAVDHSDAAADDEHTSHAPTKASIFKRKPTIDVKAFVNKQCRGERLATATKKGKCYTTLNGASILLEDLSDNCRVYVFRGKRCSGERILDAGMGARDGCYDADNFSSFKVKCS